MLKNQLENLFIGKCWKMSNIRMRDFSPMVTVAHTIEQQKLNASFSGRCRVERGGPIEVDSVFY